ncbi:hypothetical protein C5167_000961, partial [Papaver somniferum]
VYKVSIGAACGLSWPPDRIIIQVLDDSTAPIVKEGFKRSYVEACDFVTIFDADFQPDPDFLHKTIPYFIHNPEIGLVQARWEFVNARECIMIRIQEVSLNFHFKVEREVGSFTYAFFGFNGTAGVWRIAAINEAGRWNGRTTVEDMDLSVRASLKGWKFVYVSDIRVKCELPSTFKAFRYQQHRWSCGPANLFRKMFMEIIRSEQKVSLWKKIHVIYSFFLVRKIIAHIVTFSFYCVIIPTCVLFPEVVIPKWGAVYIPSSITLLNVVETPRSIHLLVYWILFETVMAMHRSKGTVIGLLETDRVNDWVVTEKLGDALLKSKSSDNLPIKPSEKPPLLERIYLMELFMGGYIFLCGCYDVAFGKNWFFIYLFAQAMAYFIAGLGYVGTRKPNS